MRIIFENLFVTLTLFFNFIESSSPSGSFFAGVFHHPIGEGSRSPNREPSPDRSSASYSEYSPNSSDSESSWEPAPIVPLRKHPIPPGYQILTIKPPGPPGLNRIVWGEPTGFLYRINLPARVLVSPDNLIVGIVERRALLRLYFTVLYNRQPVEVHLYTGNVCPIPETVLNILPFNRLIG